MVNISVKQKQDTILEVVICDHAGQGEHGQDLVCAGVSSIAVGMMNALDRFCNDACTLQLKDAYIRIQVLQEDIQDVQLLLKAMLVQLETMQITYHKFIQISNQEV